LTNTAEQIQILEDATPERIAHANDNFSFTQEGARQFTDDLLSRMARKGQLYPNKVINEACAAAGRRYYEDWYSSRLDTLAAIDYGKVSGGGGEGRICQRVTSWLPSATIIARHARPRGEVSATARIDALQEQDLVGVGRNVSGAASPHACRAVAIERFTAGLYLLAKHYGLINYRPPLKKVPFRGTT
jgi:hypothetical protein